MNIPKGDLIFENFNNRLKIGLSPEIKERGFEFDNSDTILAELFSWSKSFNQDLVNARKLVSLNKITPYPENSTFDQLIEIVVTSFDNDINTKLKKESQKILEKYALTENWLFYIEVAILTNKLLVPPRQQPIMLHFPPTKEDLVKEDEHPNNLRGLSSILNSPALKRVRESQNLYLHPSIYLTRKVTKNELMSFLSSSQNWRFIEAMQSNLPKKKVLRRERKTIFWGQIAWFMKRDGIHSWSKLANEIEKIVERSLKSRPNGIKFDPITDITPEPVELEKYYNRFIQSIENLTPK